MIPRLVLFVVLVLLPIPAEADLALNAYREAEGRAPLQRMGTLDAAAATHAADLAATGRLSHEGRDGSDVMERVRRAGLTPCFVAENIAMGQAGDAATLSAWAASPGHRRNMLDRRATLYGFASDGTIRVLVLASPC